MEEKDSKGIKENLFNEKNAKRNKTKTDCIKQN